MTEATRTDYTPTLDEAARFIRSNPHSSFYIVAETLKLGDEDNAAVSGGRFRELWKLSCGMYGSKTPPKNRSIAWIETELLPEVLRKIIDTVNALDSQTLR